MIFFWVLAWMAGIAGVIQSGVNKQLSEKSGLAMVLHLGNLVVLIGGVIVLTAIASVGKSDYAALLKIRLDLRQVNWLYLLPGLMGLFFITLSPYLIFKLGALNVFVAVIFGQVMGSVAWDRYFEDIPLDKWRIGGALLVMIGAIAVSMSQPKGA